jgi:RNA polymerase sigma-70 factor (ECF subfamily)
MSDSSQFQTLLRELQAGSQEAARVLAASYREHVLRCVRRSLHQKLRRYCDSLDMAQLVWASVLIVPQRLAEIQSPEQFIRFLAGVVRNKIAHEGRRLRALKNDIARQVRLDDPDGAIGPHPVSRDPTPSAVAMLQERYQQLLNRPVERDRRIVELRSEGHTFDEIADRLNIDERTARKVISRLKRMQQIAPRPRRSDRASDE